MKALVLAAGRSTRMKPVEDKVFLNFCGKPLLQRQVEELAGAGFVEIIVAGSKFNLEKMRKLADELIKDLDISLHIVEQKDLNAGMCGAVLAAKEHILEDDKPILIFNANDVVSEEAFKLVKEAESEEAEVLVLGRKVEQYFPGGYLEVDDQGKVFNIVEKPGAGNEPSDLVNLVVHYFKNPRKFIDFLETVESESDDLYEVALKSMMDEGVEILAVPYEGFWQPIKFPWHIQEVFRYYVKKIGRSVSGDSDIDSTACLKGEVIVESGVKIFEGAIVKGPAYIGKDSIVANGALVRDSHLGEKCVVGYNTEIARSYLGSDVWTHSNYIGDSVIGNDVSFGAGTVTGNLRLDELEIFMDVKGNRVGTGSSKFGVVTGNHVRVGINVSLMPGLKVGGNSFIGAGIVVADVVPKNSFVRGKWEIKVSENRYDVSESDRGGDFERLKG